MFASDVERATRLEEGRAGDIAIIYDSRDRFLAAGLYDPKSAVRARLLVHRKPSQLDPSAVADRAAAAARARDRLAAGGDTDGYRLVHGPGDALEGIVADRYADTVALRVYSAAWLPWIPAVIEGLRRVVPATHVVVRMPRTCAEDPACWLEDGAVVWGQASGVASLFRENGVRFEVDPVHGQKTGFFLDQRENRERVERLCKGRVVANLFSYTGGFSLYAARGGATHVTSVDASAPAVAACQRNFELNKDDASVASCSHRAEQSDVFEWLEAQSFGSFGVVVVDPPAFAKRAADVPGAVAAYRRLARLAAALVAPGGYLVSASCSSRVPPATFFEAVAAGVADANRRERVEETTGHPVDHPIGTPTAQYLKCRFAQLA